VQAVVLEAVYPAVDVAVENRLRMRLGPLGSAVAPLLLVQLRPRLGVWPSELKRWTTLRCYGVRFSSSAARGISTQRWQTIDDCTRLPMNQRSSGSFRTWLMLAIIVPRAANISGACWNFSVAHSEIDRRMQLPDRLSSQWITSRFLTHE